MTRMIEEDRTRLGTFKALGLTDIEIMSKYLIYSLLASLIGSVGGSIFGFAFFPFAATTGFQILFDMPSILLSYRFSYGKSLGYMYRSCHRCRSFYVFKTPLGKDRKEAFSRRI